ncbi:MAG: acetyl-CoA carboxylase biotin carboxyl carrier protein subunit [Bacteroidota bacterium]
MLEVKIGDRISEVKLLKQEGDKITLSIDNRTYDLDIKLVENGVYSILHKNKSFNVELIEGKSARHYHVNNGYHSMDVEIIDAQSKYIESRNKSADLESGNIISSPMPGKVVKLLVKEGDEVESGQNVIVISAMKMESDYKAGKSGIIKKINVKESQTIESNQPLIIIE